MKKRPRNLGISACSTRGDRQVQWVLSRTLLGPGKENPKGILPLMSGAKRPLRILQVISSAAQSGAERHCVDLCRHLKAAGHSVWAAVPAHSWLQKEVESQEIPTLGCRFKRLGGLAAAAEVQSLIRKEGIDLVHSHLTRATLQAALSTRLSSSAHVATVHIQSADVAYRLTARKGGRVIAVSEFIKKTLVAGGVKDCFVRVVYNGSDFGQDDPQTEGILRQKLGLPDEVFLLGVVGRIARDKGQDLALEALVLLMDRFPKLHLALIGRTAESEFEAILKSRATLKGLAKRVHFIGSQNRLVPIVDSLDLLLVPSVTESFGLAALEAMLRGKAVVAAQVGGLPEVVQHEVTGLVLVRDPMVWADAIASLLECPEKLEAMGLKGRALAKERFSAEKMITSLESVYSEAVQR